MFYILNRIEERKDEGVAGELLDMYEFVFKIIWQLTRTKQHYIPKRRAAYTHRVRKQYLDDKRPFLETRTARNRNNTDENTNQGPREI